MSYGKVKDTFWTDKKVRAFSDDAKMLALYLLTGPHRNILGCMRIPNGYMTADLEWSSERLSDAINMLCERLFIARDSDGWTLILNQLRHDPVKTPNHVTAAITLADAVPPESSVYQELAKRLTESLTAINMASRWHPKAIVTPEPLPAPAPAPLPAPGPDAIPIASPSAPPPPAPILQQVSPKPETDSRLPSDWKLPDEWLDWAITELLPFGARVPALSDWATKTSLRFRDHWLAKAGKDGLKRDWEAMWRLWVREDIEKGKGPRGSAVTTEAPSTIPPEKRLRPITHAERDLASRVKKFHGENVTDAEVAEWRKLDEARAA